MRVLDSFHPAVGTWFNRTFSAPTEPQVRAWPAIQAGRHVLVAAPTGSGKTLAAFLAAIDALVRHGLKAGLTDETHVLYVSPLKALSNDIKLNLERPLAGIREELAGLRLPDLEIRTLVRTGDTPQPERERMRRRPPHIVVTTPESLYILLTSDSGRRMLSTVRTVIVDEIHAVAGAKRGAHLALSLERLQALTAAGLTRIGLSATQKPIEEVARFLVGNGKDECTIIDVGFARSRDLAIEVPGSPLEAVMSGEVWEQVYDRLSELVSQHRTTLVFVNTRRLAERVARHLSERLGEENVTSHHGSLAREHRLNAEQRLKRGELKALVATASLELGIDIGDVELVCQLGSPRSIAAFLQRVGRSGHSVGGLPKGRLFPLSRDELIECAALLDSVRRHELDLLTIPQQPLDVLAQQIVAEVACRDSAEEELFDLVRRAYPYRHLPYDEYMAVVKMLAEGFHTRRGRRSAYLHRDSVNRRLRARRGARLTAITSGGAIPDNADYSVIMDPESIFIGTLNEDFAIESLAGDIFQLGNTSYRILRVESGRVRVEDAHGQPPTMPFWLGEAPGRSDELSHSLSRLREEIAARLEPEGAEAAGDWIEQELGLAPAAAEQIAEYLAAAKAALGLLPTHRDIVMERFFDETGGTQLVIHSPHGSGINRAWGLALRKRFCRKFNFELQAAATEDAIVLSLSPSHSFPLAEVAHYLHSKSVRQVLTQALVDAPMFNIRWRWNAAISLALPRFRGGKKVPAQLQRMEAEDLLAAVFPDQLACAENLVGEREIPEHPLVSQTVSDCLHEAMDVEGLEELLRAIEAGELRVSLRELTEPSPLAAEILNARPYAFLDDAPLEERRTQAVLARRWLDPEAASDIGRLDPAAIRRVREEAWPDAETRDELHDALCWLGFLTAEEAEAQWGEFLETLAGERRATRFALPLASAAARFAEPAIWIAAERLPQFQALFPTAQFDPPIAVPPDLADVIYDREYAIKEIARGRLEGLGPVSAIALATPLRLPVAEIEIALAALEAEGFVLRGSFTPDSQQQEWCERRLLGRVHRYTVKKLREQIEPVPAADFLRFLFDWQHVAPDSRLQGPDAPAVIASQLEGFEAAAAAWETEILPARVEGYEPDWLDDLCLAGRVAWARLSPLRPSVESERGPSPVKTTPIAILGRRHSSLWHALAGNGSVPALSSRAQALADFLTRQGASFFDEIVEGAGLLRTQAEEALAELVALGLVNSDSFSGLRALLVPSERRPGFAGARRRGRTSIYGIEDAGRWTLSRRALTAPSLGEARGYSSAPIVSPFPADQGSGGRGIPHPSRERGGGEGRRRGEERDLDALEHVARTLLNRWGVVFWRLLEREPKWLPPWRELLRVYRRLEARGEIRGGRFVAAMSGEQFALPEAVGLLREVRRRDKPGMLVAVSAADPLNLAGIAVPGSRVPALTGNRVLYRDGVPLAVLIAGDISFLQPLDPHALWQARNALVKRQVPPLLAYLG
jgi:ATP-dependent Lhr-like helicase